MELPVPVKLRPSDAGRWTMCTASPRLIYELADQLPDTNEAYTTEGSDAHEWAAAKLGEGQVDPESLKATYPDMEKHVDGYVKFCQKQIKGLGPDPITVVEERISTFYNPDQTGYLDFGIISGDSKKVVVCDLKYGAGVSVQAKFNKQLAIYAMSFLKMNEDLCDFTDDTLVTLVIYQPRIKGEEPVRLWPLRYSELKEFCNEEIGVHVEAILGHDVKFSPSEKTCQFCPVKALCKARASYLLDGVSPDDNAIIDVESEATAPVFPEPNALTVEQLGKVLHHRNDLKKWLDSVYEHALNIADSGTPIAGYKLVAGRSSRKWTNEEEAFEFLRSMFPKSEVCPPKMISAPQAEKLMKDKRTTKRKWDRFEELVTKPTGGPTLVPVTDKRPELAPSTVDVEEEFDDTGLL